MPNSRSSERIDRHDDVAALLGFAGKRPALSPDRLHRARSTARAAWQIELASRSHTRQLWITAVLVAAASLAVAAAAALAVAAAMRGFSGDRAEHRAGSSMRVEALLGVAESRVTGHAGRADVRQLRVDERVRAGATVETGAGSRVALRLPSGHSVRLDEATTIRWLTEEVVALDRGRLYVDSGSGRAPSLELRTALGVIHEVGTQFEVKLESSSLRVRLREGAVVLEHEARQYRVDDGTELTLGSDGVIRRRPISTYGPDWAWLVGITPIPDLEGRRARAYLQWVARERGWSLRFADETVARGAEQIVLGGSLGRLPLDATLDAVLPACRLNYRVADGELRVASAGDDPEP